MVSFFANEDILTGHLVVPLFARKLTSIFIEEDYHCNPIKSVPVEAKWTEAAPSPQLQEKGIEAPMDHNITCHVQEEVRLPKKELEAPDWVGCEDLHPFWLIKRDTITGNHNCEMKVKGFKQCSIPDVADLQGNGTTKLLAEGHTFHIHFPFIVNHTRIEKDAEVVLTWEQNLNQPRATDEKGNTLPSINCTRERLRRNSGCL